MVTILRDLVHKNILDFLVLNAKIPHRYSRTGMIEALAEDFEAYPINRPLDVTPCLTESVSAKI